MNANGKFDLWLVRISYLAQVGLFFLTTFTIYYTVIPIYQNASLQESIAKKEIEYKQLERKENELYVHLRSEYLKRISIVLITTCSPTNIFMRQPSREEIGKPHEQQMGELRAVFDSDVGKCLRETASKSSYLKELKINDQKKISSGIDNITHGINSLHNKYSDKLKDTSGLLQLGRTKASHSSELEKFLIAHGLDTDESKLQLEQIYIRAGAYSLVAEYGFKINDLISEQLLSE
ncbi:hypothetical protein [Klebsiella pneumoniae]|uniref:hypothetical protein n=1 Tax=Klebsiella pneumoniae TaxID=573 RepID=UPI000DE5D6E4|nr:hypothetical protein [Klebsiella pneumoniae]EIV7641841.1 hypothetical protein [Klebsiella pneumoniae]EKX4126042.1 hypothetical protein [Klebsiella pneumoniae]MBL0826487.1 hypothetical protein [Klebsiella pneumoniae]MCE0443134.1 hypothetical protein [Klebsiella pneumoniae]MCP6004019.1 hypothetical protein [Klebsiella pneumoniae]